MAAKTQYGMQQQPALTNDDIARYLQMQAQIGGQQNGQQYDPLADVLNPQAPHPVYSNKQGIADVATQVISAYARKKELEKLSAAQSANAQLAAAGNRIAMNPDVTQGPQQGPPAPSMGPNGELVPPQIPADTGPMQPQQPASWQQRAMAGYNNEASRNAVLANQQLPALMQLAQGSQKPAFTGKLGPGEGAYINNGQVAAMPALPPDILKPGVLQAEEAKTQAGKTIWKPASPQDNINNGYPATTKGAQISSENEYKPPPKQPGQVGPAYDANTGAPVGVVDYTDPDVAAKLQSGAILPHEPKTLQGDDARKLTTMGNQLQEYQQSLSQYKPEYSRIIGATSKLRGFLGGTSYNEGPDWFNHVNNTFIQGTKDIAGRSPKLIEEYNQNRPEPTDAPDVVTKKMNNLINLSRQETANTGNMYKKGGYLGQQIDQAAGFNTSMPSDGQPASGSPQNAPDPLGIR